MCERVSCHTEKGNPSPPNIFSLCCLNAKPQSLLSSLSAPLPGILGREHASFPSFLRVGWLNCTSHNSPWFVLMTVAMATESPISPHPYASSYPKALLDVE